MGSRRSRCTPQGSRKRHRQVLAWTEQEHRKTEAALAELTAARQQLSAAADYAKESDAKIQAQQEQLRLLRQEVKILRRQVHQLTEGTQAVSTPVAEPATQVSGQQDRSGSSSAGRSQRPRQPREASSVHLVERSPSASRRNRKSSRTAKSDGKQRRIKAWEWLVILTAVSYLMLHVAIYKAMRDADPGPALATLIPIGAVLFIFGTIVWLGTFYILLESDKRNGESLSTGSYWLAALLASFLGALDIIPHLQDVATSIAKGIGVA